MGQKNERSKRSKTKKQVNGSSISSKIEKYSDPKKVFKLAKQYLGPDVNIQLSTNPKKKYMVQDPNGKWIHFGAIPYMDYTKHKDDKRQIGRAHV